MSSGIIDYFRKSIALRLALMSSVFFVLGVLVLFGLVYVLLSSSLQSRDRDALDLRLQQIAAEYQTLHLAGFKSALAQEARLRGSTPYFIRIVGPDNATLYSELPDQWSNFQLNRLVLPSVATPVSFQQIPSLDDGEMLETVSRRLDDGTIVQVGKSTEDRDQFLRLLGWVVAQAALPGLLIGLLGMLAAGYLTLRPLQSLLGTVRAIEAGALDARVAVRATGDELDELAQLFNRMLGKISGLMTGMRSMVDNVAHDLRTPVTRIRGAAELALRPEATIADTRTALADTLEEADYLLRMLNTHMDISEAETGVLKLKFEPIDASELIVAAADLFLHVAEDKGVALRIGTIGDVRFIGDRDRMRQVLANLIDNAIKYTPAGGLIEITARLQQGSAIISVADNGSGVAADDLPHVWDRTYRSDQSRGQRGLGLGLSLVKAVVEAHRGTVEASSKPGTGSTFTLALPALPASPTDAAPAGRHPSQM
jgi:signal transduction histidine kinase